MLYSTMPSRFPMVNWNLSSRRVSVAEIKGFPVVPPSTRPLTCFPVTTPLISLLAVAEVVGLEDAVNR